MCMGYKGNNIKVLRLPTKHCFFNSRRFGSREEIKVLHLSTKHCFFNPIELVWAYVKGYVTRKNNSCKLKETESLTKEAIEQVREMFVSQIS